MNVAASIGRAIRRTNIWNPLPIGGVSSFLPWSAPGQPCLATVVRSDDHRRTSGRAIGSDAGLRGPRAEDVVDRELGRQTDEVIGEGGAAIGHADATAD